MRPAIDTRLAWAAALVGAALSSPAAALVIDDFDSPAPVHVSVLTGVGEHYFLDAAPDALGGVRGITHHNYTNPLGSVSALAVGNGLLSSSVGVQAQSEVLSAYGAWARPEDGPPQQGPHLNLDTTPFSAFRLHFGGSSDVLNLNIVMYTANPLLPAAPRYYTTTAINAAPISPGAAMVVDLPFNFADTDFNFGDVDGIILLVNRANGNTNIAFNLDRFEMISSVPEPGAAWLLLAGLPLLLRRRLAQEAESA
jgi:hypothetical protein